jgi:hypothetical protein
MVVTGPGSIRRGVGVMLMRRRQTRVIVTILRDCEIETKNEFADLEKTPNKGSQIDLGLDQNGDSFNTLASLLPF